MTQELKAVDYVSAIAPYDPGQPLAITAEALGLSPERLMLLNANENPLGMSEHVKKAIAQEVSGMNRYPDGGAFALRQAIAQVNGVNPDQVIHGNGSDELLGLIAGAYLAPGRRCVFSQYSFSVYRLSAEARGATCIEVPVLPSFDYDLPALVREASHPDTSVLFLTNPNNPTGLCLDLNALDEALKAIPAHVLVVLDEAYREFSAPHTRADAARLLAAHPNVLVARTFSKAYGLAGFRVGYALANAPIVEMLNRIRGPFNVNRLAQSAACAALLDQDFVEHSYQNNKREREALEAVLDQLGVRYIRSETNFMMIQVAQAAALIQSLKHAGILIRGLMSYGLTDWIRVSIGNHEQMQQFTEHFVAFIKSHS